METPARSAPKAYGRALRSRCAAPRQRDPIGCTTAASDRTHIPELTRNRRGLPSLTYPTDSSGSVAVPAGGLESLVHARPFEDLANARFHGPAADHQRDRDLSICKPFC
jgi:hypothetical protein